MHNLLAENHCFPAEYKTISGLKMATSTHLHLCRHHFSVVCPDGPTLRCIAVKTQSESVKTQLYRIFQVPRPSGSGTHAGAVCEDAGLFTAKT